MKWNKNIKSKKPNDDETVLVCNQLIGCGLILAWYEEETNTFFSLHSCDSYPIVVTHWMRLPDAPVD